MLPLVDPRVVEGLMDENARHAPIREKEGSAADPGGRAPHHRVGVGVGTHPALHLHGCRIVERRRQHLDTICAELGKELAAGGLGAKLSSSETEGGLELGVQGRCHGPAHPR
jgi:hypothetical protein